MRVTPDHRYRLGRAAANTGTIEPDAVLTVAPARTGPGSLVVVGGVALVAFALVSVAVSRDASSITTIDLDLHAAVLAHRGEIDVAWARFVTWGGATVVTLPALLIVGALAPRGPLTAVSRLGCGVLLSSVASAGVYVGLAINSAIGRARPPLADWAGAAGGPAFPSGHTTAATLFAACCAWALADRATTSTRRLALASAAVAWAAVVGWSRVWLGVHWPIDVLGGWLYGTAWAGLAFAGITALRRRQAHAS